MEDTSTHELNPSIIKYIPQPDDEWTEWFAHDGGDHLAGSALGKIVEIKGHAIGKPMRVAFYLDENGMLMRFHDLKIMNTVTIAQILEFRFKKPKALTQLTEAIRDVELEKAKEDEHAA